MNDKNNQYYEYIMIDLIVNGAIIRGFSVHYSLTSQQGSILLSVNLISFVEMTRNWDVELIDLYLRTFR